MGETLDRANAMIQQAKEAGDKNMAIVFLDGIRLFLDSGEYDDGILFADECLNDPTISARMRDQVSQARHLCITLRSGKHTRWVPPKRLGE